MRSVVLSIAAAAALTSVSASANEARVEARGGIAWGGGDSDGVIGVAAGYDFDLGDSAFAGLEVSGDKVTEGGTRVSFGFGGRLGAKVGEKAKVYVNSTYQTKFCSFLCDDSITAGAGAQYAFTESLYGKVEYRHFFYDSTDANAVVTGLGVKF